VLEQWSAPHGGELYDEKIISYTAQVYGVEIASRIVVGQVSVKVPLHWINDIVNSIEVFTSGEVYLVTGEGQFITHQDPSFVGNRNLEDVSIELNSPQFRSVIDSIGTGKSGVLKIDEYFTGLGRGLITYQPILDNGWSILFLFPEKEYLTELNMLTRRLIWIGALCLIALSLVIFLIINRLTRPIIHLTELTSKIRLGEFDVSLPQRDSKDEAGKLSDSIRALQTEIKKYIENLRTTIASKEKIESDIRIASQIQGDLIPKTFPDPETLGGLDIYGKVIPAKWVSGDLFEFRRIADDLLCFMLGDVTGKGIPASLFMAITRTLVITESRREIKPALIMEAVNEQLCENNTNSIFVTAILGVIELSTGQMEYCNAGHVLPYISTPGGGYRKLEMGHGLPLGLFSGKEYGSDKIRLEPGGSFLCFSDGITEAENMAGEFFGEARVDAFTQSPLRKKEEAMDTTLSLIEEVDQFTGDQPNSDDMTILVLHKRKD
jgi:sigma-B regulation protein RsbU (phosphoserine phosphatase)